MDEQEDKPVGETFGRLIDDGKAYVRAEVNLVRTRVDLEVERFRPVAILGAAALLCAVAALVAGLGGIVVVVGARRGHHGQRQARGQCRAPGIITRR